LAQVFEPFFTTKGDLGTGIGLWVTKKLVEARGGEISIASSTENGNRGTISRSALLSSQFSYRFSLLFVDNRHGKDRDDAAWIPLRFRQVNWLLCVS
jgi:signal transduction histidine kinase